MVELLSKEQAMSLLTLPKKNKELGIIRREWKIEELISRTETIELKKGEYYIQRPNILQEGVIPSLQPNYYFIHFTGHYSQDGSLPLRGTFNIEEIQEIIDKFDNLKDSSEKIEKEVLFYEILTTLKKGNSVYQSLAAKLREYILDNYNKPLTKKTRERLEYVKKYAIDNNII